MRPHIAVDHLTLLHDAKAHRDLQVWQRGMELARKVYRLMSRENGARHPSIMNSIQTNALKIPSVIAEGHAQGDPALFAVHLGQALGAIAQLDTQIVLAENLGVIDYETRRQVEIILIELDRMTQNLYQKVSNTHQHM